MVGQAKSRKESLIYVCLSYNFPENNNGQLKMKTVQNVHNISMMVLANYAVLDSAASWQLALPTRAAATPVARQN